MKAGTRADRMTGYDVQILREVRDGKAKGLAPYADGQRGLAEAYLKLAFRWRWIEWTDWAEIRDSNVYHRLSQAGRLALDAYEERQRASTEQSLATKPCENVRICTCGVDNRSRTSTHQPESGE